MKLLLERWRGYLNEAQGKTLEDYHDVFYGMMRDWQEPGEGFPKKEYEDLFYVKDNLSPSPLDGNPLKELIGKRVRASVHPVSGRAMRLRVPGYYDSRGNRTQERFIPMTGQEATIESIYIWTKHRSGPEASRGVHATLNLKWDEDTINQLPRPKDMGSCGLDHGNINIKCFYAKPSNANFYGIELV